MHFEIVRHQQQLDGLFGKYSALPDDQEMRSHWARYLCVQVSGFTEESVRRILAEFARTKSEQRVHNFVEANLVMFRNPSTNRVIALVRQFSPTWADAIQQALDPEMIDAVNSIIGNRHLIAHGRPVGLTYVRIKGYYAHAIRFVQMIDRTVA